MPTGVSGRRFPQSTGWESQGEPGNGTGAWKDDPMPKSPDLPGLEQLPDLDGMSLEELRTVRHPVLDEVLAELSSRIDEPTEMLWGFNNFV